MTRILLVGKNGQIGWELHQALRNPIVDVIAVGKRELDVTDRQAVMKVYEATRPDIVVNATGYNNVDAAERNVPEAISVNVTGNANLAQAARQARAFYITYSTDYVFDGRKNSAYTEADLPNPLNVYGRTKLDGELAIKESGVDFLIIRTSSVFSLRRPCFLSTFLKAAQPSQQVRVRTDLISSPTSAHYLANSTAQLIQRVIDNGLGVLREHAGTYQLAGTGSTSRYEWAQEIRRILKMSIVITPASDRDFATGTIRPSFSALDSSKFGETFQIRLVPWQQLLEDVLKELV